MRWFFLLLLLTNLGVAGWLYSRGEPPPRETVTLSNAQGQGRLQLLSELPLNSLQPIPHVEAATETASSQTGTDTTPSVQPTLSPAAPSGDLSSQEQSIICVRISPLAREADVDALTHKLTAANLVVLDSGEEFTDRQTYWVMIPPYNSESAARDAAAKLAKAKVRDFQLIRSGEFKDGISLGLFSQKDGADSRLQEILTLKLNIRPPEIRPRTSSVRSHWLITRVSGDEKPLLQQLAAEGLQGTTIECPP